MLTKLSIGAALTARVNPTATKMPAIETNVTDNLAPSRARRSSSFNRALASVTPDR
jgi:hypothetical protein